MIKNIKGEITITSPSGNAEYVSITIDDKESRLEILEVKISYEEFTRALMHHAFRPCDLTVNVTDKIGKKMEHIKFEFEMPKIEYSFGERKEIAKKTVKEQCPEGWYPDMEFNSQYSFFSKGDSNWARTTIRRWV
jgi:hypothetical protein